MRIIRRTSGGTSGPGLAFTTEPTGGAATAPLSPSPVVTLETGSTVVPGFTGAVTVALANNPDGAVLGGTTTVSAVAGVATFSNLTIDKDTDSITLKASATGLLDAFSTAFDVLTPPTPFWWDTQFDRRLVVSVTNDTGHSLRAHLLTITKPGGITIDANSLRAVEIGSNGAVDRAYDWRNSYANTNTNRFDDLPIWISGSAITLKTIGRWVSNETRRFALYWKAAGGIAAKDWSYLDSVASISLSSFSQWAISVVNAVNGNTYRLVINGTNYTVTAGVSDTTSTIATSMRTLINAGTDATAGGAAASITITPVNARQIGFTLTNVGTTVLTDLTVTKPIFWALGRVGPDTDVLAVIPGTSSTYPYACGVPYGIGGTVGLTPGWGRANTRLLRTMQYKANGDASTYGAASSTVDTQTRTGPTIELTGTLGWLTRSAGTDWSGVWNTSQRHRVYLGRRSDSYPYTFVVTAGTAGDVYAIVVNGTTYSYTMVGGDTATVIASALVALVNAGTIAQATNATAANYATPGGTVYLNGLVALTSVTTTGTTTPANMTLRKPQTATVTVVTAGTNGDLFTVLIGSNAFTYAKIGGDTTSTIATALKALIDAAPSVATCTIVSNVLTVTPVSASAVVQNTGTTTPANMTITAFATPSLLKSVDINKTSLTYTVVRAYAPTAVAATQTPSSTNLQPLVLGSSNNNATSNVTEIVQNEVFNFSAPVSTGQIAPFAASADLSALPVVGTILGTHGNTNGLGIKLTTASLIGFPWTALLVAGTGGDVYKVNLTGASGGTPASYQTPWNTSISQTATDLAALINADSTRLADAAANGSGAVGVLTLSPRAPTDATFAVTTTGTTVPAHLPMAVAELKWAATSNPFAALQVRNLASNGNIPLGATINLAWVEIDGFTNAATATADNLLPDEVVHLLRTADLAPTQTVPATAESLYSTSQELIQTMATAGTNAQAGTVWIQTNALAITGDAQNYGFQYDTRFGGINVDACDDDDDNYGKAHLLHGLCLRYLRTHDTALIALIENQVKYHLYLELAARTQYNGGGTWWDGSAPYWVWPNLTPSIGYASEGGVAAGSAGGVVSLIDPLYNSGGGAGLSKGAITYTRGQARRLTSIDQMHMVGHAMYAYLYLLRNESLITSTTTAFNGTNLRTEALNYLARMVAFENRQWSSQDRWIDNLSNIVTGSGATHTNGIDDTHVNADTGTALANPYWGEQFGPWNVSNGDGAVSQSSANLALDYLFRALFAPGSTAVGIKRFIQGQSMDMLGQSLGYHEALATTATWGKEPTGLVGHPNGWQGRSNSTGNVTRYNAGHTPDKHWLEIGSAGWRDTLFGRIGQRMAVLCMSAMIDSTFAVPVEQNGVTTLRTVPILTAIDDLARVAANYLPEPTTNVMRYGAPGVLGGALISTRTERIDTTMHGYWMMASEMWQLLKLVQAGSATFSTYYNPRAISGL